MMVICKDKKCDFGYSRCCATCEMFALCDKKCENAAINCTWAVISDFDDNEEHNGEIDMQRKATLVLITGLIIVIGTLVLGNLNSILISRYM